MPFYRDYFPPSTPIAAKGGIKARSKRGAFATRIAYVSVDGQPPAQRYQLIVADADGENPRIVREKLESFLAPKQRGKASVPDPAL